jgi:hypothetical protein
MCLGEVGVLQVEVGRTLGRVTHALLRQPGNVGPSEMHLGDVAISALGLRRHYPCSLSVGQRSQLRVSLLANWGPHRVPIARKAATTSATCVASLRT